MKHHYVKAISELVFIERQHLFNQADVVLYHPGHYAELNPQISKLYESGGYKKIMIPSVLNTFLKDNEYEFHKNILRKLGVPEEIILPIQGTHANVSEVVSDAMKELKKETNILLAGKAFFCRRFLLLASLSASDKMLIDVFPLHDNRDITKDKWHLSERGIERVFGEAAKINEIMLKNQFSAVSTK